MKTSIKNPCLNCGKINARKFWLPDGRIVNACEQCLRSSCSDWLSGIELNKDTFYYFKAANDHLGELLDAWEHLPNDMKYDEDLSKLTDICESILQKLNG